MRSLRGRVLLLATGIATLVIVLAAVPLALLLRSAAHEDAEREATFAARNISDYLSTGSNDDSTVQAYLDRANARQDCAVSVITSTGTVLGAELSDDVRTAASGKGTPRQDDADGDRDGDGDGPRLGDVSAASTVQVDGGRLVEILAQSGDDPVRVVAFVSDDDIDGDVRQRYLLVAAAALALLVLAALAAEVTSRRLVRPLRRTAATAGLLSAGDLTARAPEEGPTEVAQVAVELNALANRIDELLRAERETTADLSHRLRTPLTAVRLGVESLPDSERKQELEQQVGNLERTLTQVIRAARRPQREGVHPRCDAAAVLRDRLAFWTPLAEDQQRDVAGLVPGSPVWVRSSADDLATTLDALLENVMAHTPEGTPFEVRLVQRSDDVLLEVLDDGPGIPAGATSRGHSDRGSSGLGLDIARSATESVGGSMTTGREGGRTVVRLLLLHSDAPPPEAQHVHGQS